MSHFSAVDSSPDPAGLVAYLDRTAAGLTAMKHYVAAAARRAVGSGVVLDVGCGAGHDLDLLARAGVEPVGTDPSATMLDVARTRSHSGGRPFPLVRATAEALPFAGGAVDGCRIERVLLHVARPEPLFAEMARVVRPGGFLAVFEPDWRSLRFVAVGDRQAGDDVAAAIVRVRHPDIGGRLAVLADEHGFHVEDVVTELSFARRIDDCPLDIVPAVERAVAGARLDAEVAAPWLARQQALDGAGQFRASWAKVLVVATRQG